MTTQTNIVKENFAKLNQQKCAKYVQRIVDALERKALAAAAIAEHDDRVKVHLHCIDYATDVLSDSAMCKFLHAANADESVAEFVERMSNVKAIDYVLRYARALSHDDVSALNNYMCSTVRALIDCDESISYSDARAALSTECVKTDARVKQMHYSSSTASAQASMTVNALEALTIVKRDAKRSKDAQISVNDDDNARAMFDALTALVKRYNFTR